MTRTRTLSAQAALLAFLALLTGLPAEAAPRKAYATRGTCDGLPRIALATPPGVCIGLLASGLRYPRGLLPLADGTLLVASMGNWEPRRGGVWQVARDGSTTLLLGKLDRPHGLVLGPNGRVYVGVVGGIISFDPARPEATRRDEVGGASGLPAFPSSGRHPLIKLLLRADGKLVVNIGSHSNNCEADDGRLPDPDKPCAEAEGDNPRGSLRLLTLQWPEGRVTAVEVLARGLRNSVALAQHPGTGALWQGENARDAIGANDAAIRDDEDLPPDELNLIEPGRHYGWPYCWGMGRTSPEYPKADCARYVPPRHLLPGHAAPLGMVFNLGAATKLPPAFDNTLLIGFHGYRNHGHRIVAYKLNADGAPIGAPMDLVSGWSDKPGIPLGAPTDLQIGPDGELYVSDDRNGAVLRISAP